MVMESIAVTIGSIDDADPIDTRSGIDIYTVFLSHLIL